MKPTHARIADLWCRLTHAEPMWPSHGQYECRTCGRRYPVCWQEPLPAASHRSAFSYETPVPAGAVIASELAISSL
jgi:hypothetical protein